MTDGPITPFLSLNQSSSSLSLGHFTCNTPWTKQPILHVPTKCFTSTTEQSSPGKQRVNEVREWSKGSRDQGLSHVGALSPSPLLPCGKTSLMLPFCSSFQEMLDSQNFIFNLPIFKCCVDQILPAVSYAQPGESPLVALTYILLFEADPSPKRETEGTPPISAEETEAEHGKLPLSQREAWEPELRLLVQPAKCWIPCQDSACLGGLPSPEAGSATTLSLCLLCSRHAIRKGRHGGRPGRAAPEPCLQLPFPSHQTKCILGMQVTELLL